MKQECKVVFLDRDGVINKRPPVHQYVSCQDEMILLPGAADAIRRLNEAGFFVFVVSNQRGIQRGIMTMEDVNDVNDYLNDIIAGAGAHIDKFYVCPHGDNECECRKPKPGLLLMAEADLHEKAYFVNKEKSFLVGDSNTDIAAGNAYGVKSLKIGESDGEFKNLEAAVDRILELT